MNSEFVSCGRLLCLHAAARRLRIPERTLRYQASRGRIQGAFKQGKLWKFSLSALESVQQRQQQQSIESNEVKHDSW
jgi:hypothetical protein